MAQLIKQRAYFPLLDLYRAIAAALVVLEHSRNYLLADFSELANPGLVTKGFYFLTQFGHEAVLLFFVLSGLVVGRIVVDKVGDGTWSWSGYLFDRLTRLWLVLIPAVFLTGVLDFTAMATTADSHFVNQGEFAHIQHHPLIVSLGLGTLLGNICFLQTIFVPPYGSNGPLWSLAYEFWYYILFAGLWVAAFARSGLRVRVAAATVSITALCVMSLNILVLFGVWLMGVIAYMIWKVFPLRGRCAKFVLGSCLLATFACLGALRLGLFDKSGMPGWLGQYILGITFAVCVWASLEFKQDSVIMRVGGFFSKFSYSLYLVHLPALSLLTSQFISNNTERMLPSIKSFAIYSALVLALYLVGYLFFLLTENNTGKLRRLITRHQPT